MAEKGPKNCWKCPCGLWINNETKECPICAAEAKREALIKEVRDSLSPRERSLLVVKQATRGISARRRAIFKMKFRMAPYARVHSYGEIAREFKISRQRVRQIVKRILSLLEEAGVDIATLYD